jgi:hypothetical protein
MFKKLTFLLLVSVFSLFVQAQKFDGGVLLGLVGSQVAGDLRGGFDKAGLNAGGWISLGISPKSLLQMELAYVQKGSRENQDLDHGIDHTYIMHIDYIELPFLYRYIYNERFELETGLGMNFLIYQKETEDGYVREDHPFRKQNLCFLAGIAFKINERLKVNLRTDNSLITIRTERVNGDVWRFWGYGQFSDALVLSAYYKL